MSNYRSEAVKYLSEQAKKGGFNYTSILYSSEVIILTGSDAEAFAVLETKGHWIEEQCGALKRIVCSECGKVPPANVKKPYCPNCGSPME